MRICPIRSRGRNRIKALFPIVSRALAEHPKTLNKIRLPLSRSRYRNGMEETCHRNTVALVCLTCTILFGQVFNRLGKRARIIPINHRSTSGFQGRFEPDWCRHRIKPYDFATQRSKAFFQCTWCLNSDLFTKRCSQSAFKAGRVHKQLCPTVSMQQAIAMGHRR